MMKWTGAALLAATLVLGAPAQLSPAAAASAGMRTNGTDAADVSARRHDRHYQYRYAHRSYPYYYGRPVYYSPLPFLPIPPLWGYGWEWW